MEAIATGGRPARLIAVVGVFTDEEGSWFALDMLGSLVYVGGLLLEEALSTVGVDGKVLGEELLRIGYAGPAPCPARPPHAPSWSCTSSRPGARRRGHRHRGGHRVQGSPGPSSPSPGSRTTPAPRP
ncbi:MAG: hypothetical protein U0W40_04965 [Acidimicrobiia bacterium]